MFFFQCWPFFPVWSALRCRSLLTQLKSFTCSFFCDQLLSYALIFKHFHFDSVQFSFGIRALFLPVVYRFNSHLWVEYIWHVWNLFKDFLFVLSIAFRLVWSGYTYYMWCLRVTHLLFYYLSSTDMPRWWSKNWFELREAQQKKNHQPIGKSKGNKNIHRFSQNKKEHKLHITHWRKLFHLKLYDFANVFGIVIVDYTELERMPFFPSIVSVSIHFSSHFFGHVSVTLLFWHYVLNLISSQISLKSTFNLAICVIVLVLIFSAKI